MVVEKLSFWRYNMLGAIAMRKNYKDCGLFEGDSEDIICQECGHIGNFDDFKQVGIDGYGIISEIAKCENCGAEETWDNIENLQQEIA